MNKFLLRAGLPAGALMALLALGGCLGADDEAAAASYTAEVLDIDEDDGTIRVRETYWVCEDGDAEKETETITYRYDISGGELLMWDEEDVCLADRFEGSSKGIVGTWTADPPEEVLSPDAEDDLYCSNYAEENAEYYNHLIRETKIVQRITEDEVKFTVSGQFCDAEALATSFSYGDGYELTKENCTSAEITREDDDEVATFSTSVSGSRQKYTFKGEGETCTMTLSINNSNEEPNCSDDWEEEYEDFLDCVNESGFFDYYDYAAKGYTSPAASLFKKGQLAKARRYKSR